MGSMSTLHLQEQLANIRAECRRLEVAGAHRAGASTHVQELDEEALYLHGELERVNAKIAKLDGRNHSSLQPRAQDSAEALRNVVMLKKRNMALERVLAKCMDPSSRIVADTELKRLVGEVDAKTREIELRTIELRQLNRTADHVGRQRVEAEKRGREEQDKGGDGDARHLERLTEVNLHHKERAQGAVERLRGVEHEWNGWLQPMHRAAEVLRTRPDAPLSLRKLCDEPSPALSLIEVMRRLATQFVELKDAEGAAAEREQHTLEKLERLHLKLVHQDEMDSTLFPSPKRRVRKGFVGKGPTQGPAPEVEQGTMAPSWDDADAGEGGRGGSSAAAWAAAQSAGVALPRELAAGDSRSSGGSREDDQQPGPNSEDGSREDDQQQGADSEDEQEYDSHDEQSDDRQPGSDSEDEQFDDRQSGSDSEDEQPGLSRSR